MSAILQFENATYTCADVRTSSVEGVSFTLPGGGLVQVEVDREGEQIPFVEMATGLIVPKRGRVRYRGKDWCACSYAEQTQLRGRIGSLSAEPVWLANQTVLRNVLLKERHHTARGERELEAEADALARMVGLECVPRVRPDSVSQRDLGRAGLVRAFCGAPALLVLVLPERHLGTGGEQILESLLAPVLARGGAAMVVTGDGFQWNFPVRQAVDTYRVEGGVWRRQEKGGAS